MTERFIIAARKKGTSYNLPLTRKQKKKIQGQWTKFLLIALKYVARCGHISSERCFLYSYYHKWMKFCPIDCVFFLLSVIRILFSFFQVFFSTFRIRDSFRLLCWFLPFAFKFFEITIITFSSPLFSVHRL